FIFKFVCLFLRWGINPRKLSQKRTKRKGNITKQNKKQARVDAHVHDLVSAEPQYAQVNKKRKQNEDGLHYAEIQVLQSENATSRGKFKQSPNYDNTEYATIDFATTVNTQTSAEPADIFIPPGELQRPNTRFPHKKNVHSKRAVMA
uniref:Zgc:193711 n=1 Tax=Sinocyclocheilus anshuiensis TaxID=1608454 RepID=A0A671SE84_9TELE